MSLLNQSTGTMSRNLSNWASRDLDLANRSFAGGAFGSVLINFGLSQARNVNGGGVDAKSVMLFNKVISGEGKGGWMFDTGVGGNKQFQTFSTLDEGLNARRAAIQTSKGANFSIWDDRFTRTEGAWGNFNKARHAGGLSGANGLVALNVLGTAMSFYSGYGEARSRGEGVLSSGVGGAVEAGKTILQGRLMYMALTNPWVGGAAAVGAAIGGTGYVALNNKTRGNAYRQQKIMNFGGMVNPGAYNAVGATMRQRSLQSMHSSQFNAMKALGNEAGFHHMAKSQYGNYMGATRTPILGY